MNGFGSILALDAKLLLRNGFAVVMAISLAVSVVAVHLIPDRLTGGGRRYVLDASEDGRYAASLPGEEQTVLVADRRELDLHVRAERSATGIVLGGNGARVVTSAPLTGERRRLTAAILAGAASGVALRVLEPGAVRLADSDRTAVVLVAFEIAIIGFLFISVLLLQEKQEGVIRAYRVTPAGALVYVASRGVFWTAVTVVYGALFLLATLRGIGMSVDRWMLMLGLFTLAGATMTYLGLVVATFFRSLSGWFFPGVALLVLNMLPSISFAFPSFSPGWIRAIPSYHLLFAARDILFGQLEPTRLVTTFGLFGLLAAVLLGLSWVAVRFKLLREST